MDTIVAIFINIGCSVIASIIAVLVLPLVYNSKIKISPFIAKSTSSYSGEGLCYSFKIVNRSIYTAFDVSVSLNLLSNNEVAGQLVVTRSIPLSLVADHIAVVAGYRPRWMRASSDNCVRFRTLNDIGTLLAESGNSISITVTSRHPLTCFVSSHTQAYRSTLDIKDGYFTSGSQFSVLASTI